MLEELIEEYDQIPNIGHFRKIRRKYALMIDALRYYQGSALEEASDLIGMLHTDEYLEKARKALSSLERGKEIRHYHTGKDAGYELGSSNQTYTGFLEKLRTLPIPHSAKLQKVRRQLQREPDWHRRLELVLRADMSAEPEFAAQVCKTLEYGIPFFRQLDTNNF